MRWRAIGGSGGSSPGAGGLPTWTITARETGNKYVLELGAPKPNARSSPLIWNGVVIPGYTLWGPWVGAEGERDCPWWDASVAPPYSGHARAGSGHLEYISRYNMAPPYVGNTPYHDPYTHPHYDVELVPGTYVWADNITMGSNLYEVHMQEVSRLLASGWSDGANDGYDSQVLHYDCDNEPHITLSTGIGFNRVGAPYTFDVVRRVWPAEAYADLNFIGSFEVIVNVDAPNYPISVNNPLGRLGYSITTPGGQNKYVAGPSGSGFGHEGYGEPRICLAYDTDESAELQYKIMSDTLSWANTRIRPYGPGSPTEFCPCIRGLQPQWLNSVAPDGLGGRIQYRVPGWATSR